MADTRNLSPAARLLYDGVKETKQGIEIKTQDGTKALENIAKHLGMFAGKVDSEEASPLGRLVQHMMGAGNAVPVNSATKATTWLVRPPSQTIAGEMDGTAENLAVVETSNAALFRENVLSAVDTLLVEPEQMRYG